MDIAPAAKEELDIFTPDRVYLTWKPLVRPNPPAPHYKLNDYIYDYKTDDPTDIEWAATADGHVFLRYLQVNRLVYTRCDGVEDYTDLSIHHFESAKTTGNNWETEEKYSAVPPGLAPRSPAKTTGRKQRYS